MQPNPIESELCILSLILGSLIENTVLTRLFAFRMDTNVSGWTILPRHEVGSIREGIRESCILIDLSNIGYQFVI